MSISGTWQALPWSCRGAFRPGVSENGTMFIDGGDEKMLRCTQIGSDVVRSTAARGESAALNRGSGLMRSVANPFLATKPSKHMDFHR
jgi:hypothetical protein